MIENSKRCLIQPFDFRGVSLTPSRFYDQFLTTLDYFMALPADDMLMGFRRRAGLPHPGIELGGWYSNESSHNLDYDEMGNPFPQWISALCRMYAATDNPKILNKVQYLVSEWGKTVEPDGYFFYSRNASAYHYTYDKFVCALVDALCYCKYEPAAEHLKRITQWAIKNLVRYRLPAQYENWSGWNPFVKGQDEEWYTLGENLYRAYLATGDQLYKDYAFEWHYDYYWDYLAAGHPEVMTDLHGYSHVNTLSSAAMAYQVLGDPKFLKIIKSGYDLMKRYQWLASGGYAPAERLANIQGSNWKALETCSDTFEVPCGTWGAFKLSRYLISFTGKANFGEWIETLLYNAIGAALPIKDDHLRRGRTYYYGDYRITGGRKVYYYASYPCCSGSYPQDVVEYFNLIYYYDADSLYITQFIPSSVGCTFQGHKVTLQQETGYPETETITFIIQSDHPIRFNLKIRIPAWSHPDQMSLSINDEKMGSLENKDDWLIISRTWMPHDRLYITIPMSLRFVPVAPEYPQRTALMYGPVMLAMLSKEGGPLHGNIHTPAEWIEPILGEPLHFKVQDALMDRHFVPFYEIGERVKYYVYNDVLD